jgi:sugar lactone lactonase YvrE
MSQDRMTATQVTAPWADHGEGPIWDSGAGVLRWVDMHNGDVLSWRPGDDAPIRWHVSEVAAALRRRRDGGFVVATARGFSMLSRDGVVIEELPPLWNDRSVRMNDGACDPAGRFYCGSMGYDEGAGRGTLHRLDADRATSEVLGNVTISNGLGFSDDGRYAFHIDTPTRRLVRYTVTDSGFLDPLVLVEIPDGQGFPDGMSIDADGGFWIAMWDGAAVRHFAADGQPLEVVRVLVARPTSCAFGGEDGRTLFITTSFDPAAPHEVAAGAIFSVRTEVAGAAEEFYAG